MRIEVTYVLSFVDILFAAELGNILVIEKCEGVLMTASHHQGYRFVLHYPNLELNLSEYYGYLTNRIICVTTLHETLNSI